MCLNQLFFGRSCVPTSFLDKHFAGVLGGGVGQIMC